MSLPPVACSHAKNIRDCETTEEGCKKLKISKPTTIGPPGCSTYFDHVGLDYLMQRCIPVNRVLTSSSI